MTRLTVLSDYRWLVLSFAFLLPCAVAAAGADNSAVVDPGQGYAARDLLPSEWTESFCPLGDAMAVYSSSLGVEIVDPANPAIRESWGKPTDYSGWISFMTPDPSGNSLWVGFTVTGNADDRIYQVSSSGWAHRATLKGNFDLECHGGHVYASANPSGMSAPNNAIYLVDASGNDEHDVLAETGGYSAGLGLDAAGNLYYATSATGNDKLVRFSAAEIASAIGEGSLSLADAEPLLDMAFAPYDTDVDDAGHVVIDGCWTTGWPEETVYHSSILVWSESGTPESWEMASRASDSGCWFGMLHIDGNVAAPGGRTYVADSYCVPGIAEIVRLIPGDADGDGTVDEDDAAIVASNWGDATDIQWDDGDFNGDGRINAADAALVTANWGASLRPTGEEVPMPEPATAALLLAAATVLAGGRRFGPRTC